MFELKYPEKFTNLEIPWSTKNKNSLKNTMIHNQQVILLARVMLAGFSKVSSLTTS